MKKTIILSRIDSIGDVVLTLPMAGAIKKNLKKTKIVFLGKDYVKPIVDTSSHIDEFLSWDEVQSLHGNEQIDAFKALNADVIFHVFPIKAIARLAAKAKIPMRVGTSHRTYHWMNCNYRLSIGRKNSDLHEAQLNLKLMEPLGIKSDYQLNEIADFYGFNNIPLLPKELQSLISMEKPNVILHPKSKGSAREWGLYNFGKLIELIWKETNIIVTGTGEEGALMSDFLEEYKDKITDITGRLSLPELISLINASQFIVAASTGPLHIGAALGVKAIGIYAPMRPIHPGRWGPIGKNSVALVLDEDCEKCRKNNECRCIQSIKPEMVQSIIFKK